MGATMPDLRRTNAKLKKFPPRRIAFASAVMAALSFVALNVTPASAQLVEQAIGLWTDENGEAYIEIGPCGGDLCGRIVWLKEPTDKNGLPLTDVNNPDQSLRSRPMLGLVIMTRLHPNADNSTIEGQVCNAKNGNFYDVYITPKGHTMEIEGCFMNFL